MPVARSCPATGNSIEPWYPLVDVRRYRFEILCHRVKTPDRCPETNRFKSSSCGTALLNGRLSASELIDLVLMRIRESDDPALWIARQSDAAEAARI
jgi:hypothetical protein